MFVREFGRLGGRRIGEVVALVWMAAVVAISLVECARAGWVASLAASPDRVREGKLWFLISSGVLVDRPIGSRSSFIALAVKGAIIHVTSQAAAL